MGEVEDEEGAGGGEEKGDEAQRVDEVAEVAEEEVPVEGSIDVKPHGKEGKDAGGVEEGVEGRVGQHEKLHQAAAHHSQQKGYLIAKPGRWGEGSERNGC